MLTLTTTNGLASKKKSLNMNRVKLFFLMFVCLYSYSCNDKNCDLCCSRLIGKSSVDLNYKTWDRGKAYFQYIIENGVSNDGSCDIDSINIVFTQFRKLEGECLQTGLISLPNIPLRMSENIGFDSLAHFTRWDGDVAGERYRIFESGEFENYLKITDINNNCDKVSGEFQFAVILDVVGFNFIDPASPDTLLFLNGTFEAETF